MAAEESAKWWEEAEEGERTASGIPSEVKKYIFDRDEWRCQHCGSEDALDPHHVIWRSQRGTDDPENLVTLCRWCHSLTHDGKLVIRRIHGHWYFRRMA